MIVWTDSGTDNDLKHLPIPNIDSFESVLTSVSFCPTFFETELQEQEPNYAPGAVPPVTQRRQPLSVLPKRYGETLDWKSISLDPILALQELFNFQSAAAMQYLNMTRKVITQLMAQTHINRNNLVDMEDILHYEYAKTVLARWSAHFTGLIQVLETGPLWNNTDAVGDGTKREEMLLTLKRDLEFLQTEAGIIIELCEAGKSTVLSNFSISEARRTTQEAKLVTELTKATNRLTFIFLPISFVTSVFGMNFRQFGQGPLTIWLWVAVTLPLLVVCVITVEWGRPITSHTGRFIRWLLRGKERLL